MNLFTFGALGTITFLISSITGLTDRPDFPPNHLFIYPTNCPTTDRCCEVAVFGWSGWIRAELGLGDNFAVQSSSLTKIADDTFKFECIDITGRAELPDDEVASNGPYKLKCASSYEAIIHTDDDGHQKGTCVAKNFNRGPRVRTLALPGKTTCFVEQLTPVYDGKNRVIGYISTVSNTSTKKDGKGGNKRSHQVDDDDLPDTSDNWITIEEFNSKTVAQRARNTIQSDSIPAMQGKTYRACTYRGPGTGAAWLNIAFVSA